jgi:hypothetical protein
METIKCNLCGSDKYRVIYSMPGTRYFIDEWFNVVGCINYGLGFVNPRPSSSEMSRCYPWTIRRYLEESGFDFIRADYSNKIYSMRSINFLRYYFYRYFMKQRLERRHTQFKSPHSIEKNTLRNSLIRKLMHLIFDPLDVIDQLLLPIYERYQIISETYGIVTYIARRR